jgi:glycosyltransferase involved in cell wall biosynthesis
MSLSRPALSVITPTRDYGRFLPDCLASVALQDRQDVEHIVIDGASTDETVDILRDWGGPGRRWISEPDRNQSDALNKGLRLASADWVCWLNADEFYLPGTLGVILDAIAEGDADIISGDYAEVDGDGKFQRLLTQHDSSTRVLRWFGPYMPSCGTFFRRRCVPEGGFDESLRYVMDWDLWLRMTGAGARVRYIPRAMAAFTLHGQSLTGQGLDKMHPELQALRARHGCPTGTATGLFWWLARAERVLRRQRNGSRARASRAAALLGRDLRWFAPEGEDAAARDLAGL